MFDSLLNDLPSPVRVIVRGLLERFKVQLTKANAADHVPDAQADTEVFLLSADFGGKPVRGVVRVG